MEHKRLSLLRRIGAPLIVVALLLVVVGNLQAITDYVRLRGYQPPDAIASLADETTMTPEARRLFYINHPEIDDRQAFNTACTSNGEQTIVLGCYHPKDRGIFVFAVQNSQLEGVEEVTAAHEMLHAAYDRLGSSEKKTINAELQAFYETNVTDQRVRDTVAAYQKSEPNDVVNEMHSIFGTEIATLTPELQRYYQRYFADRSQVVQLAANYQAAFTSRQDQVASYDKQLTALKADIDANTARLKQQEAAVTAERRQLESYRASGDIQTYNARVPAYNANVQAYNMLVQQTQNAITRYNQLVATRNGLALEVQQLTESINSKPTPIGS